MLEISNLCILSVILKKTVRLILKVSLFLLPFDFLLLIFSLVLLGRCSSSSLSCDGSLTLVSSIKELRDKYKVQVLASQEVSLKYEAIKVLFS